MKKIYLAIAAFFIAFTTIAQSNAEAVKLLKTVTSKYNGYKTMSMDVNLTIENLESKTKEQRKGKAMLKGNKFNLNLENQQVICDGKTIWVYVKDYNEVQINNFNPKEEMITPDRIFKIAEKDYLVMMGEKVSEGGKSLQIIELTPNDKSQSYSKIKVYIDPSDNSIQKGVVFDKNAIHLTYAISNFKANGEVSDSNFAFDKSKYPGVEVIDLRQ
ncbi:MAG: outer membrane lipoprotein carrier protein LolA [Chitinophagales bacterium]|nr:outer membrane lipoprotein carrier protein LolA [Bacteroidota bacterium]